MNKNNITTDEVKAMISDMNVRLDRKTHYALKFGPLGLTYRIGHHEFVTFEEFGRSFDDYENAHEGVDWSCYLYILVKNQPELLNFYTQAYNIGGLDALRVCLNEQGDNGPQPEVYLIRRH